MKSLHFQLFTTGYCKGLEKCVRNSGSLFTSCRFPATAALIEHPERGRILFDTGYSPRIFDACQRLPYSLYPRMTPITLGRSIREQVGEVETIFLSHFHADHICGLRDFPKARFIYSKEAWEEVKLLKGWKALKKAFLPQLIPEDFAERSHPVSIKGTAPTGLSAFPRGVDILGDGSLYGISLPGHARGQMGIYFRSRQWGPVFLIADAVWQGVQITLSEAPPLLSRPLLDDAGAYFKTICQLHQLRCSHPELIIIPTHCEQSTKEFI